MGNASLPHPHPYPPPEGEGKEGKALLMEEKNDYILPLQGGGWEGDGDLLR